MVIRAGFTGLEVTHSTYPFSFGKDPEVQYKMLTLVVKETLDELDAHDKAKEAFFKHVPNYSTVDEEGNLVLPENTFKLTVCRKPHDVPTMDKKW